MEKKDDDLVKALDFSVENNVNFQDVLDGGLVDNPTVTKDDVDNFTPNYFLMTQPGTEDEVPQYDDKIVYEGEGDARRVVIQDGVEMMTKKHRDEFNSKFEIKRKTNAGYMVDQIMLDTKMNIF